ncbi:hypothetica protein [Dinoroseobacter shibae DFL 12 = DSM 16493]|uniref:Hypothetica protein n=2 Tax=Dinoroseobacter shibae TaxID=215813 RepID=A8LPY0_DINSH|nr:hypothetical protein [Dinoroseobacter shibae]ABV93834.1 hypothetica protein [Dinoroseobacter shibae DFL 12 = DSM 16493]URF45287.1 hypothetical protein M8008_10850 [Dinoroseobacter shibae]URF49592.1 hypothetical protein M8007_10850 [Dinoroseobacter shibae]
MPRAPLKPMPADVLDTIRQLAEPKPASNPDHPPPLTLTEPIAPPPQTRAAPRPAPRETPFVDRIVTHLARPEDAPSGPLSRPPDLVAQQGTDDTRSEDGEDDARPCTLLLTPEFQIRPPEPWRLPLRVDPLAGEDYAEDSDLDRFPAHDAVSALPEMSEALRAAVGKTMRAALAEAGISAEAQALDHLVDAEGRIDTGALRQLVRDIVRQELRAEIDALVARRLQSLVRTEITRSLDARDRD